MRENVKQITIEDRTFILKKMPAARGFSLLMELATKVFPAGTLDIVLANILPFSVSNTQRNKMSMEELEQLQLKILSFVSEQLEGILTPVVDKQGHFQVEDLEYDMMLFGELLLQMLMFQYMDFFLDGLGKLGLTTEDPEVLVKNLAELLKGLPMSASTSLAQ